MSTTIEVPEERLPSLLETAMRTVAMLGDDLEHDGEEPGELDQVIAKVEAAVAAYKDVRAGLPLSADSVRFLAQHQIDWECGDDAIRLPSSAEECSAFAGQVRAAGVPDRAARLLRGGVVPPTLTIVRSDAESPRAITTASTARFTAWLRREIECLPAWHALHPEYARQLAELEAKTGGAA